VYSKNIPASEREELVVDSEDLPDEEEEDEANYDDDDY